MTRYTCFVGLLSFMALAAAPLARAQETVKQEPIISSIDPTKLTYDLLVDGNLPQDDLASHQFKTLQAAYAAAPEGTEAHPTVIGIKPNVYLIPGSLERVPSLAIRKNWITLLGLTNNRRSVVLADNRGLAEGANDDGYLLDVNATGFTARNLTIINYCNCNYEYPGDPSKNLKMRNPTITQAVALQASGDKHVYDNVALLSRLDTMFLRATRSYFKNVYIEGTDDWMGGGQMSFWQDSTLVYPTGRGVMSASNCIFLRCTFEATMGLQFYKAEFGSAARPNALIDCTLPVSTPQAPVAWVRGVAVPRPNQYSLTYKNKDTAGNPAVIYDDNVGGAKFTYARELSDEERKAYNPWNLLRAAPGSNTPDDWDPANAKSQYANQENLIYRVNVSAGGGNGGPRGGRGANIGPGGGTFPPGTPSQASSLRTGGPGMTFRAQVQPAYAADTTITWSTASPLITLSSATGPSVTVTANNATGDAQFVPITVKASNGFYVTAYIYAEPKFIQPPAITAAPKLTAPKDGKITLDYTLDLAGRDDQSLITWSLCDDANGGNPKDVDVTRGNEPLKTYTLMPGDAGKFLRATLQPKHKISEPGPAVTALSASPIAPADIPSPNVSADFRHFVPTPTPPTPGRWTILGDWSILPESSLPTGYGLRAAPGPAGSAPPAPPTATAPTPPTLLYFTGKPAGDMQLDLVIRPEKTEGTVFNVPGSPIDAPGRNSHGDFYIKYDPLTRTGYSLRYWRTTQSNAACVYQFYKHENGVASPCSDQQTLTGVFKRNTTITLKATGNTLSVSARNSADSQTLSMQTPITPNPFSGAGISSTGSQSLYGTITISYP